jgi:hypothetical protein
MAADFLRPDGELSEPSLRLVALYCDELISGRAGRHGLVAEWPELCWLLFGFAADAPELTVGLHESGWWPDSVLSGPDTGPDRRSPMCSVLSVIGPARPSQSGSGLAKYPTPGMRMPTV